MQLGFLPILRSDAHYHVQLTATPHEPAPPAEATPKRYVVPDALVCLPDSAGRCATADAERLV